MTRNTQFLINVLLTLLCYFALCAAIIAVTHSGYCRCGVCEDCKLRRSDEETTMMTMWPKVALFNYFAVEMPFEQPKNSRESLKNWLELEVKWLVLAFKQQEIPLSVLPRSTP